MILCRYCWLLAFYHDINSKYIFRWSKLVRTCFFHNNFFKTVFHEILPKFYDEKYISANHNAVTVVSLKQRFNEWPPCQFDLSAYLLKVDWKTCASIPLQLGFKRVLLHFDNIDGFAEIYEIEFEFAVFAIEIFVQISKYYRLQYSK